jgi:hypothetical protein
VSSWRNEFSRLAITAAIDVAWLLVEITTASRGRPLMALPTTPSVS